MTAHHSEQFTHDGIRYPIVIPLVFPVAMHVPETGLAPVQLHVHPEFEGGFFVHVQSGSLRTYEKDGQHIPSAERADVQYGTIGLLALADGVAADEALAVGYAWIKSASTIIIARDPGDMEASWLDGRRMGHIGCDVIGFYWVRGVGVAPPEKKGPSPA